MLAFSVGRRPINEWRKPSKESVRCQEPMETLKFVRVELARKASGTQKTNISDMTLRLSH